MKEQLTQYVNLLFAGASDCEDIKQEILQNTLDRFDDLVSQGKSPEAAYRLAISGIGDVNEILGNCAMPVQIQSPASIVEETEEDNKRKKYRAIAIAMYIMCAIPLVILSEFGLDTIGLCLTLALVACATYLIIISGKKDDDDEDERKNIKENDPQHKLKESIGSVIWTIGLVAYFGISFLSGAWYITWVIFPMMGCLRGLSDAIIDLKEVKKHEI